jgi:hypothetical protein
MTGGKANRLAAIVFFESPFRIDLAYVESKRMTVGFPETASQRWLITN